MLAPAALLAADHSEAVRGKLTEQGIRLSDGRTIVISGDEDTMGVLHDPRLVGSDFEVMGKSSGPGQFQADPIQDHALFVYRNGKRLRVTYWCDVCAIRTYTPGLCWCCREDTVLDPKDPADLK